VVTPNWPTVHHGAIKLPQSNQTYFQISRVVLEMQLGQNWVERKFHQDS